jgi:hypothetical protein
MFKRLLSFGCSFTYGHGLSDCVNIENSIDPSKDNYTPPSNFAWPARLADSLSIHNFNCSQPGSSNKYILYKILESDVNSSDLVTIMWTNFIRHSIIINKQNHMITPWRKNDPATRSYYSFLYNEKDSEIANVQYINYANLYLKTKGCKVLNFCFFNDMEKISVQSRLDNYSWNNVSIDLVFDDFIKHGLSPDKYHPSENAHAEFSKRLFKYIKNTLT